MSESDSKEDISPLYKRILSESESFEKMLTISKSMAFAMAAARLASHDAEISRVLFIPTRLILVVIWSLVRKKF